MATNRFRQVLYEPDTDIPKYVPQEFVPDLSGIENVMAGYQAMTDKMYDIPIPKHIEKDRNDLQKEYVLPLKTLRDQAVDAFASGNTVEGIRAIKNLDRFLAEAKQPGGVYESFESRYGQEKAQRGDIDKLVTEKERQDMAPYLYEKVGYRPFRSTDGTIQSLAPANYDMVLKAGEFDEWINKQLPFIKETLLSSGYGKMYDLGKYTTLHEMKKDMGVNFNKVIATLAGRLPSEMKDAFRQEYQMNRSYDPSLPELGQYDPAQIFETDEKGNIKTDKNGNYLIANTPMGRSLEAAGLGYQHVERTSQYFKVDDEVSIARAKEGKNDDGSETQTLRTPAFITGTKLPKLGISGGKMSTGYRDPNTIPQKNGFEIDPTTGEFIRDARGNRVPVTSLPKQGSVPIKTALNSPEFMVENPVAYEIWNKIKGQAEAEKWDDKKIGEEIERVYQEVGNSLQTSDMQFKVYTDPDEQKDKRALVIGTVENGVGRLGSIENHTLYVNEPGKPTQVMSFRQFMKEHKMSPAFFIGASNVIGELDPGKNPFYPSGFNVGVTISKNNDKGEKYTDYIQVFTTPQNLEDANESFAPFELASPSFDPTKERSEIVRPNFNTTGLDPANQQVFNVLNQGIYSVGDNVWESNKALKEAQYWENIRTQRPLGKEEQQEYDKAMETYKKIQAKPNTDKFAGRQALIFSSATDEPVMIFDPSIGRDRQMTHNDLNQIFEATKQ